ncbi:MAG: glycosyltransferase family 39 protein [Solirubrobacteraceae bacterium]
MSRVAEIDRFASREPGEDASSGRLARLPAWWPLAALTLLAAALRLSTLDLQSFWYDEAFTPVHVLHPSLVATLHGVVKTENTPPLWYIVIWAWSRIFGVGMIALRFPSAVAGVLTVPVAWAIGRELSGGAKGSRRAAIVCAGIVAVNPLFVWYSQEARAYGLYVLLSAVAMLCFLRAEREATPRRLAAFAVSASLALLSFYFEAFLLIPMALWLLRDRSRRRATLPALALPTVVGLALVPLILAQGGHGTQWISRWPLSSRIQAIPQYYLTGYSGAPLGRTIELVIALLIVSGIALGLWRGLAQDGRRGALLALVIVACGVLIPLAMAVGGADYLAPRNVVAAMVPLSALIGVCVAAPATGRTGMALAAVIALAFLAVTIDVNFNIRLQRSDWRGVAKALRSAPNTLAGATGYGPSEAGYPLARVITIEELGSAPLEYYLPPLHNLVAGQSARVREIDEIGFFPLRPDASVSPAPGFHLAASLDIHDLIVYRFVSPTPRAVSEETLINHVITLDQHAEVLVSGAGTQSISAP